ncbi:hypothetical protein [Burkholderia sp. SIMBA_062]
MDLLLLVTPSTSWGACCMFIRIAAGIGVAASTRPSRQPGQRRP